MDWILEPTVMSALVAGIVALVTPALASRLKRKENGRIAATAVDIRRIDAAKELRDELRTELQALRGRCDALEQEREAWRSERIEWRSTLVAIEDNVEDLHRRLCEHLQDHPSGDELARMAMGVLERIRRGRQIGGAA